MTHHGGCHCGRIAFDVDTDGGPAIECNCSVCSKRGALLWFVPRAQLRLSTPAADLGEYRFNKRVIAHHFCPTCGVAPFAFGTDTKGNAMAAVNVRCLDGVDLATVERRPFDGRSL